MYEVRTEKKRMRAAYSERRNAIPVDRRSELSAAVCRRFISLVTYRYSGSLLMYSPIGSETDISDIARQALADGKTVAYPRCYEDSIMKFHIIGSLDELERGMYGIYEPPESLPVFDPASDHTAACLIPALVYDKSGYRLGYGKGYYDRYLTAFKGVKVGVVYNDFVVKSVPRGRYDIAVDMLVTDKGVISLNG